MVRQLSTEKRQKFLNAALALFASKGVQNTTTAEIAKATGTATGTLFLYFSTKQDLINALVLTITQEQSTYIKSLLDPVLSVRDTFFTVWNGSVRWFLDNPQAYQYSQQIRDSGLVSEAVARETGKYFNFYYETIQKGLAEERIKPFPIDLIGGFLYQDIVAVMNYLRLQPDPAEQVQSIRQGFELFWDGISIKKE